MSAHRYKWIRIPLVGKVGGSARPGNIYGHHLEFPFQVRLSTDDACPAPDAEPSCLFGFVMKDPFNKEHPVPRVQGLVFERVLELLDETPEPRAQLHEITRTDVSRMQAYDEKKIAGLSGWT